MSINLELLWLDIWWYFKI